MLYIQKKLLIGMPLALLVVNTLSFADAGFYAGLKGGTSWQKNQYLHQNSINFVQMRFSKKINANHAFSAVGGYRTDFGLMLEIELSYRKNELRSFNRRVYEGGKTSGGGYSKAFIIFSNLWYNIPMPDFLEKFNPYIGAGIGRMEYNLNHLKTKELSFGNNYKDQVTAYQLGTGVGYNLNKNIMLTLDYRYIFTESGNFGNINYLPLGDVKTSYKARSVSLGIIYSF